MKTVDINKLETQINSLLDCNRFTDALSLLLNTAKSLSNIDITDKIEEIKTNYNYMLQYFIAGTDDPSREILLQDMKIKIGIINDLLKDRVYLDESTSLYYNLRRYFEKQPEGNSLINLIENWGKALKRTTSLSSLIEDAKQSVNKISKEFEDAEIVLFNRIWTLYPLSANDANILKDLIIKSSTPANSSIRFIWALILNSLEIFNENAWLTLCVIYNHFNNKNDKDSISIVTLAILGLVLVMFKFKNRSFSKKIKNNIDGLRDLENWEGDIKSVLIELVRAKDTERITRTMQEEIIPEMMTIQPDIEKKLNNMRELDEKDDNDPNFNPEWEEILNNSPLIEKLKELNELQNEGSDVFMSTFAHLKHFPFFNEIINWFTPMNPDSYEVKVKTAENPEVCDLVESINAMSVLCDSDKFSMLCSFDMIPPSQRKLIMEQMRSQNEAYIELHETINKATAPEKRKMMIRNHLHNLYRFVNLFRRKNEFYNIFNKDLRFFEIGYLPEIAQNVEFLRLVGEFYFQRKYYNFALDVFRIIDDMGDFDAILYQKIGFAYEKLGLSQEALKFYEQAELLGDTSKWLYKRLAIVYRNLDRIDDSMSILNRLHEEFPDDDSITMLTGYTCLKGENYREAVKHFYAAQYKDEKNPAVNRPLAWCLLMIKDFNKSQILYEDLVKTEGNVEDYLNLGHAYLLNKNIKEAVKSYRQFKKMNEGNKDCFIEAMNKDKPHLLQAGLSPIDFILVCDAVSSN